MFRRLLYKIGDPTTEKSLSSRFRRKRFEFFKSIAGDILNREIRILDVGGTTYFWEGTGFCNRPNIHITLLNLKPEPSPYPNIESISGDARDLSRFEDRSFDIVFSNSVIEHVGDFNDQMSMAKEIQRVGKRYLVQTPNYYFPMETHFLVLGWQFLPCKVRAFLLRHMRIMKRGKVRGYEESIAIVNSIRLLTKKELRKLFPRATLYCEKFFGITKSLVAYEGFDQDTA